MEVNSSHPWATCSASLHRSRAGSGDVPATLGRQVHDHLGYIVSRSRHREQVAGRPLAISHNLLLTQPLDEQGDSVEGRAVRRCHVLSHFPVKYRPLDRQPVTR